MAKKHVSERVAVVGLGYVGLPVAVGFAKRYEHVVGYDIDGAKIAELERGVDRSLAVAQDMLRTSTLRVTDQLAELADATTYIVTVPTPIDGYQRPDLSAVVAATEAVGSVLCPGDLVVYESTVYPGVTQDVCGPILAAASGLDRAAFQLGYSPERINPGDEVHTLETVIKIVAGEDDAVLDRVARLYEPVVTAGVFRAANIEVAEAAKVIENAQRDINIALMNELALICDRLQIRTRDVLDAAGTKWNFLRFHPGLVGGHCIGVDPYYLTAVAETLDYHPQMILAGRRINDSMGVFVAQRTVKLLTRAAVKVHGARVAVLGLTFKEDFPDIRNSRVVDLVEELREFGVEPLVHDPMADPAAARAEYGIELVPWDALDEGLDGIVLAVKHRAYMQRSVTELLRGLRPGGVVVDVKSVLDQESVPQAMVYWCL